MIARALGALMAFGVVACAPLAPEDSRAGRSSLGCMQAAIAGFDLSTLPDDHAHCIGAGLIARRCSATEAMLASVGKEIHDALGQGDAAWRDLRADRRGVRCAKNASNDAELSACCVRSGPVDR